MQVEAAVSGTPVIAFNRSASQESVHPSGSLMLNEVSIPSLVEAILSVCRGDHTFSQESLEYSRKMIYRSVNPYTHAATMFKSLVSLRTKQQQMYSEMCS